jgi:hypothetical protein
MRDVPCSDRSSMMWAMTKGVDGVVMTDLSWQDMGNIVQVCRNVGNGN